MPLCQRLYYFEHAESATVGRPPLVLLHGAAGNHLFWPTELRRLPGRTVLALDLPGHGRSVETGGMQRIAAYAAEVIGCLHALDIPRVILAGHSMGGALALALALSNPELVAGLVLISTAARFQVNSALLAAASPTGFSQAVEDICRWSFSSQADPRLVALARQRMTEVRPSVLHGDLLACAEVDFREDLSRLACPTLVLCGSEDRMTPLRQSQYLADAISGARLQVIEGAGHMLMLEQPQPVAQVVGNFCDRLSISA